MYVVHGVVMCWIDSLTFKLIWIWILVRFYYYTFWTECTFVEQDKDGAAISVTQWETEVVYSNTVGVATYRAP